MIYAKNSADAEGRVCSKKIYIYKKKSMKPDMRHRASPKYIPLYFNTLFPSW